MKIVRYIGATGWNAIGVTTALLVCSQLLMEKERFYAAWCFTLAVIVFVKAPRK